MPPELAVRWEALLRACGVEPAAAEPERAAVVAAYGEPHRVHHRLAHVAHLVAELDAVALHDPAVAWAAWYHDVVYVPGRADNEERSARRAREGLEALGLGGLAPRVVALVLATRDHLAGAGDEPARLFLDADLAVLGAHPAEYRAYARAIRLEFAAVPDLLYARGRRRFLSGQLARPAIFGTPYFRGRLERQARENLAAELARLGGR